MDIFAGALSEKPVVKNYIEKHYGPIPRLRGVRFMRYEEPETCRNMGAQSDMWAEMCGKDIIYIHTRCGGCWDETDPDSNYIACGGKAWEDELKDKFIESVNDFYDSTYRDHYFIAVIDDDYNTICQELEDGTLI